MKFILRGLACYEIEVHTDGYPQTVNISEEFDAPDFDTAVNKSREIIQAITQRCHLPTEVHLGGLMASLEKVDVKLSSVQPIWSNTTTMDSVAEVKESRVIRKKPHSVEVRLS